MGYKPRSPNRPPWFVSSESGLECQVVGCGTTMRISSERNRPYLLLDSAVEQKLTKHARNFSIRRT